MRVPALICAALLAAGVAAAQDAARPAYDGSDSPNAPRRIYVDQDCRIVPDPARAMPDKKTKPFSDPVICHLETINNSTHVEERIEGDQLLRNRVYIAEQEFVLQNIMDVQAMFVVQVPISADWQVDSDPQPASTEGNVAVFPVYANPGQIVRLHVGLRHTQPMKTKYVSPGH